MMKIFTWGWRRDPWSGGEKSPPDLDKIVAAFANKVKKLLAGGQPSVAKPQGNSTNLATVLLFLVVMTVVLWGLLGIFIVSPSEEAVILRFGRYVATVPSGPHWIARGIESETKVNIQQVNSFSFGADYLTQASDDEFTEATLLKNTIVIPAKVDATQQDDDTDKNVVYAELSVQYRVIDPKQYLFSVIAPTTTLTQAASAALSEVIGAMRLNSVLTVGRDQLTWEVKKRLQAIMDSYRAGIEIVAVNVRKIQAPEEVANAFLDVVQAGQDQQRYIQQAQAYARKVIPMAEGRRNRILAQAHAYQQEVILNAQADIASYSALLQVYQQAPQITRDRLYLETMESVFRHSSKILLDTNKDSHNFIQLPLDKFFNFKNKEAAA